MTQTRRLAAVPAADVAGYSRLIGFDEGGTLRRLRAIRDELACQRDDSLLERTGFEPLVRKGTATRTAL
jgi:hypothetical protein